MLTMTVKYGEKLYINGGQVEITPYPSKGGGQVRLSIEADRSIDIDREKVHEAKVVSRLAASLEVA